MQLLPSEGQIVLGEFHNHNPIQSAQAEIIRKKIEYEMYQGDFAVHWEFLNHTDQSYTAEKFQELIANMIDPEEFIRLTAGEQNLQYASIVKVVKDLHGDLFGINLPRKLKQRVIQGGIRAIDAKYVPAGHYVGGDRYKERFIAAMGNHVPANKIDRYFLAQCLTDSVMADQIAKNSQAKLNFVVAGSFHTDYFDGTVIRLNKLMNSKATTFKFASLSLNSEEEIETYKKYDEHFGYYADYIIITD